MPAYHCSSSSSAPRNRSSPAIRKVPRQMAAVKMRTRNQRPRLLTVLRSRRATRPPLSWTAKLIPRSTCLSKDGSSWHSPFPSFCPETIGYCGTWSCICRGTPTASEWAEELIWKSPIIAAREISWKKHSWLYSRFFHVLYQWNRRRHINRHRQICKEIEEWL